MTAETMLFTIEEFFVAAWCKLIEWAVSEDELEAMRLYPRDGERYQDWSFDFPRRDEILLGDDAADRMRLIQLFCTARWLMTNPRWTRDRDVAFEAIVRFLAEPDLAAGRLHRMNQRSRARKPRVKLAEDGTTMRDVARQLLQYHPGESASTLWYHLKSALAAARLDPVDTVSGKDGSMRQFTYDSSTGGKRTITEGRFATIISSVKLESRLPG